VFDAADQHLDSDAVFGVKNQLITPVAHHEPGTAADGTQMGVPFHSMSYDLVLEALSDSP